MSSDQQPAAIVEEKITEQVIDATEEAPATKEDQTTSDSNPAPNGSIDASPKPVSDIEKKQRRAERFGVQVKFSEDEKRKLRASRFSGLSKNGTTASFKLEEDKWNARAARFGTATSPTSTDTKKPREQSSTDEETKKKARLNRFAGVDTNAEDEKKRARAERFAAAENDQAGKKKLRSSAAPVVAAAAQG